MKLMIINFLDYNTPPDEMADADVVVVLQPEPKVVKNRDGDPIEVSVWGFDRS